MPTTKDSIDPQHQVFPGIMFFKDPFTRKQMQGFLKTTLREHETRNMSGEPSPNTSSNSAYPDASGPVARHVRDVEVVGSNPVAPTSPAEAVSAQAG